MFYIYAYENKINGKVYVGQTCNLSNRHTSHVNSLKKTGFDAALAKYGKNNFDLFVIEIVDTTEQANQAEIFWISEMREFLGRGNVYNLTDGGQGARGVKFSEEAKQNLSKKRLKEGNPFYGKKHSQETLDKMREKRNNLSDEVKKKIKDAVLRGENHPMFGKTIPQDVRDKISKKLTGVTGRKLSDEARKNISLAKMGDKNPNFGKTPSADTKKKLSARSSGENNPKSKLKSNDVIEIRKLLVSGLKAKEIASMFNISEYTIIDIKRGKTWKNIK